MSYLNRCCACQDGGIVDLWKNETLVRLAGGSTSAPFARFNQGIYDADHPGGECSTLPAGSCGPWLQNGDQNGISAQEVDGLVADIIACAPDDSTHSKTDHNCYVKDGVVDLRMLKRFGGQWFNALHHWHGMPKLTSRDFNLVAAAACPDVLDHSPDQSLFCQLKIECRQTAAMVQERHFKITNFDASVYSDFYERKTYSGEAVRNETATVGKLTGILTMSDRVNTSTLHLLEETSSDGVTYSTSSDTDQPEGFLGPVAAPKYAYKTWGVDCDGNVRFGINEDDDAVYHGFDGDATELADQIEAAYTGTVLDPGTLLPIPDGRTATLDSFSLSGTALTVGFSITGYAFTITYDAVEAGSLRHHTDTYTSTGTIEFLLTIELGEEYTATAQQGHLMELLANVDMSDFIRAPLRTDGQLANALLALYDEVGPTTPYQFPVLTMDDYSGTISGGIWPQMAWLDPNSYQWVWPDGSFTNIGGATGGATLITGLRTGDIISYTRQGAERHWWPAFRKMRRDPVGGGGYQWVHSENGAFSASPLPRATKRWMDNLAAQSDSQLAVGDTTYGNQPQDWIRQQGQTVVAGKYCEAVQKWESANEGRPCGPDRYAVDQRTVCCITETGSTHFRVKKTGNATTPGTSGGIVSGNYIVMNSGVYICTGVVYYGVDGDGNDLYTLSVASVASPIELPPSDFSFDGDYIGALRFYDIAKGICGRAAISGVVVATGTATITTSTDIPWLRIGDVIDLKDSAMSTVTNGGSLTILTRTGDNVFTAAVAGAITGAVWMIDHGVDWTKYNSSPRHTGVRLVWTINRRDAARATGDQPDWLGGSGAGTATGLVGVTALSLTEFTYDLGNCRAIVGAVPYYDDGDGGTECIEDFKNTTPLFAMPTIEFDLTYGAMHLGATELTMPDPFYQQPFKPDCDGAAFQWLEDDGSGIEDDLIGPPVKKYFPYRRLVEAVMTTRPGTSLPTGIHLFYEAGSVIYPPYFPYGIPVGNAAGDFGEVWRPFTFTKRVCDSLPGNRFADVYTAFVTCP